MKSEYIESRSDSRWPVYAPTFALGRRSRRRAPRGFWSRHPAKYARRPATAQVDHSPTMAASSTEAFRRGQPFASFCGGVDLPTRSKFLISKYLGAIARLTELFRAGGNVLALPQECGKNNTVTVRVCHANLLNDLQSLFVSMSDERNRYAACCCFSASLHTKAA